LVNRAAFPWVGLLEFGDDSKLARSLLPEATVVGKFERSDLAALNLITDDSETHGRAQPRRRPITGAFREPLDES
jgi:hypothetical protein